MSENPFVFGIDLISEIQWVDLRNISREPFDQKRRFVIFFTGENGLDCWREVSATDFSEAEALAFGFVPDGVDFLILRVSDSGDSYDIGVACAGIDSSPKFPIGFSPILSDFFVDEREKGDPHCGEW